MIEPELNELALAQYGLLTRRQILDSNVTRQGLTRRVSSGLLVPMEKNVFRMGPVPESIAQRTLAIVLSLGDAAAAGRTAAALHGIPSFHLREIEVVTTGNTRRAWPHDVVVHRTLYLPQEDVYEVRGIPTTCVARTLLDLGGWLSERKVRRAVLDSLDANLITIEQLQEQLRRAGRCGRPGTRAFRKILDELNDDDLGSRSELEDIARNLLVRNGYPEPLRQQEIVEEGALLGVVDLCYPDRRIIVEVDGWAYHASKVDFMRDRARQNSLVAAGWHVFRFTNDDALRPLRFLADLARLWARLS